MGRGLSPLQKWMLVRALDGADRGREGRGGCDLTILRTLSEFYRVPLPEYLLKYPKFVGAGKVFHYPDDVLLAKSHRPAIVRAMDRLEQRELVGRIVGASARWSGINLTAAGQAEANRLKATDTEGPLRTIKPKGRR